MPLCGQVRNGFYIQDLIQLNDQWYVMGGVRYDHFHLHFNRSLFGAPLPPTEQDFNAFTPRAGVVCQPIPEVLSYSFRYTHSFQPPNGFLPGVHATS
ncbi:MAG: TonB-dependent receptor [Pirellulaceae bacterium]|nr:TonB-dependent receptor [Pirellulaceae bacterium]